MNWCFEYIPKIEKDPGFNYLEINEREKCPAPVQSRKKSLRKLLNEAMKDLGLRK